MLTSEMIQSKTSPYDFIRDSFTPRIGILCSTAANQICSRNNLSFIELLRPFCKLNTEVHYKDPNGTVVQLRNLKISPVDVNSGPPQPALARKYLNSSVADAPTPRLQPMKVCDYDLEVPCGAPWFESWRETFLQVQYPADHEFTKHFLACILVVATSDENPIESMVQLTEALNRTQNLATHKLPKWFNNNVLRYYVLLHENRSGDSATVNDKYEALKVSYGPNSCFLLRTNSQMPTDVREQLPDPWSQFISNRIDSAQEIRVSPDNSPSSTRASSRASPESAVELVEGGNTLAYHPLSPDNEESTSPSMFKGQEQRKPEVPILHGGCMSTDDVEQVKLLVHEFCSRALLPYIEKLVHQLSDYVANKKGVSKSLFSATKRWFTPNKPTSSSATINTLTYPPDAPELQIRKLGDLYFMFGHYSMAFQAYHSAKRDFMADQAWLYYAGALEMAALAAFMANESTRKTFDYMEESITTYLNTCKMAQFATRATLLSSECLKNHALFGEAAHQLIRMTSEESDLRSALLLEQASYCFLHCSRPNMIRKYAFHMVLAGHRFTKAAQRKHSLRCYKQAHQIYRSKGWNLAEDHIHYTIGRQANNVDEQEESVKSYAKLLTGESKQSSQQQAIFFKEYLTVHSMLLKKQNNLLAQVLPLPLVIGETVKVLVGPAAPLRTPGKVPASGIRLTNETDLVPAKKWNKLEEMLVHEAQGSASLIFKPSITLFTHENITNINPIAVIGEPIQVAVELQNPLQILLNLRDIYLLWQYKDSNNRFALNEIMGHNLDHIMKTHYIKSVVVQANSKQEIILTVTPMAEGEVLIKGICYSLVSNSSETEIMLRGKQVFHIKGPKVRKKDQDFKADRRLEIKVVPSAPCLQVGFGEMHSELLRNELQEISVELRNVGSVPLHKIYMATSKPHLLSSSGFQKYAEVWTETSGATREKQARKNHVSFLPLPEEILNPGQHYNISLWMKAPEIIGPALIDLLIYYENTDSTGIPRYRVVRHTWQLSIQESIRVDVCAQQSCDSKEVERLALTVKVKNLNQIHHAVLTEICLMKAALLSTDWVLAPETIAPAVIKLRSQECVYLFLKVFRKFSTKSNYSEVTFKLSKSARRNSNSAYLDFAERNERSQINVFDDGDGGGVKKHDATLVLRWQAQVIDSTGKNRHVLGQNHVPVDIVAIEEETADDRKVPNYTFERDTSEKMWPDEIPVAILNDKLVTYNLLHPPMLQHDFGTKKLCIVPVKLLLHGISESTLVVKIQTSGTSSATPVPLRTALFYPHPSDNFRWTRVGSIVRTLEPLRSVSVSLSVAVLNPGTYDLGSRIKIWCQEVDQPETSVLQSCRVQSCIVVNGVDS